MHRIISCSSTRNSSVWVSLAAFLVMKKLCSISEKNIFHSIKKAKTLSEFLMIYDSIDGDDMGTYIRIFYFQGRTKGELYVGIACMQDLRSEKAVRRMYKCLRPSPFPCLSRSTLSFSFLSGDGELGLSLPQSPSGRCRHYTLR